MSNNHILMAQAAYAWGAARPPPDASEPPASVKPWSETVEANNHITLAQAAFAWIAASPRRAQRQSRPVVPPHTLEAPNNGSMAQATFAWAAHPTTKTASTTSATSESGESVGDRSD